MLTFISRLDLSLTETIAMLKNVRDESFPKHGWYKDHSYNNYHLVRKIEFQIIFYLIKRLEDDNQILINEALTKTFVKIETFLGSLFNVLFVDLGFPALHNIVYNV